MDKEQRGVADSERYPAGSGTGGPGTRGTLVLGALWLVAAVLAARLAAEVLRLPPDQRLPDLDAWTGPGGLLVRKGSLYDDGTYTGTPFSGLVLKPLTRAAEQGLGVAWTFGTLLLVVALGVLAARALPAPVSPRTRRLAAPVAVSLIAVALPVRNTFSTGQITMLPVLMTMAGWLWASRDATGRRWGPVLIGLAAALQPALLLFAPLLWCTGRRRAAGTAAGTFAAATAVAWPVMPDDSWAYWIHHSAGAGLGGPADAPANQSLHGALLRFGLDGPGEVVLALALGAAVAVLALRRAAAYSRDGQLLLAAAVTGCAAIAVAPATWQHQQLWILLAAVGRVGRRTQDRFVWPVFVVLVMTLHSTALVPKVAALSFLTDDATLLAALLAACVVPFLARTSERWERPVAAGVLSRPNLMLELLLIRVGYWVYSYIRGLAPDGRELAEEHGRQVLSIEKFLHVDLEHWLNHAVARTGWLESSMNFYYSTFHFLVPLSLLAWLYVAKPPQYRLYRAALAFATLFALIGFWAYPLAPPRLMPGLGYIDTANGPQDFDDPKFGALTGISNQYAAMPSLHVGWSLWCALVLFRLAPWAWLRWGGFVYPLFTTTVIMGTANHYLLDAVGGAAVVTAGFAAAYGLRKALDALDLTRAASALSPPGRPGSGGRTEPAPPDRDPQPERT